VTKPSGTEQPPKRILILAGPNGAGKTTFAREFLPDEAQCPTFVNADLIAAGLSPFRPELAAMRAGRLMLELIGDLVARGESFAFETTLADRGYVRRIAGGSAPATTSQSCSSRCRPPTPHSDGFDGGSRRVGMPFQTRQFAGDLRRGGLISRPSTSPRSTLGRSTIAPRMRPLC
jgi:hypothetical protein